MHYHTATKQLPRIKETSLIEPVKRLENKSPEQRKTTDHNGLTLGRQSESQNTATKS